MLVVLRSFPQGLSQFAPSHLTAIQLAEVMDQRNFIKMIQYSVLIIIWGCCVLSYSLLDQPLASKKSFSEDYAPCPPDRADGFVSVRYRPRTKTKTGCGLKGQCRTGADLWPNPLCFSLKKGKREQMTAAHLISPSKGLSYGCFCWMNFGHIPGLID